MKQKIKNQALTLETKVLSFSGTFITTQNKLLVCEKNLCFLVIQTWNSAPTCERSRLTTLALNYKVHILLIPINIPTLPTGVTKAFT